MTKVCGFTGWLFFGLVTLALLVFSNEVQAQQDHTCQGGHNCNDGNGSVAVDVVTGSNRGIAVSGADMAIDDCLATWSIFFGLVQDAKINKLCLAAQLENEGKYEAAAQMRCSIGKIRKVFGTVDDCVYAVRRREPELETALGSLYNQAAQYDEQAQQQQELEQQVEEQAANFAVLLERINRKERVDAAVARKVRQQKAEDNVYLRGLVNELKALSQGESTSELAQTDD